MSCDTIKKVLPSKPHEENGKITIIVEGVKEPYLYFWNCSPTICPNYPGIKLNVIDGVAKYSLDVESCSVIVSEKSNKCDEYAIDAPGVYHFKDNKWEKE